MRVVTSKALLTAAAALIAVPGAAIAAADPEAPLLQVGSAEEGGDADETEDDSEDAEDGQDGNGVDGTEEDDPGDHEDDGTSEDEDGDPDADENADEGDGSETEHDELDETSEVEDVDDGDTSGPRGEIVSTVAHCAPRGQEHVEGFDLANHGAYVSAAARGETLQAAGESYDLSGLEGAVALCGDLDEARNGDAPETAPDESTPADTVDEPATTQSEPAPEQQRGNGNGNGAAAQDGGPGNSGNAPGRNR